MKRLASKRYKVLEHTADLAFMAYGKDLKELFSNAGFALFDVLTDLSRVEERTERSLHIHAGDLEQLMVKWLNELLYFHDVEELLFKRFEIEGIEDKELKAVAYGEEFRPDHHIILTPLKAVTHHQIEVVKEPRRWRTRVIVDL